MLRLAICDDMSEFITFIKTYIEQWNNKPFDLTVDSFDNGDSLIEAHAHNPYDLILLDVVMPLLNGIETASEIRNSDKTVKIVFLTTSPDFAVESYTVKANNYLLKPIKQEQFYQCLNELYEDILRNSKYITVKSCSAIHRIELHNIEYIESQGKKVLFTLSDGSMIETLEPLYSFKDQLLLEDGFFKCHRSYIVNLFRIKTYTNKEILMQSGYRIPISRNSQKEFETIYFSLLFGKAGER